jgi:transposase
MFEEKNLIGTDVLDHFGLVAATIDKLGIAKQIDRLLPMTKGAKTTYGQRASAMILNGLGFMDDRLYLFPTFLENKPVSRLLGEGLCAKDFNDDALGRFLDAVHAYGETKLYSEIALPIALKHKLVNKSAHIDTTSLTVYGEYSEPKEEKEGKADTVNSCDGLTGSKEARPEYGHAKNKRFDLKQMTLMLATTGAAGFPIWMESHSGNASDKKTLEQAAQRMQQFCKALESSPSLLYVGDSAMYANCVKHGDNLLWLSRVPENSKSSKQLLLTQAIEWVKLDDNYNMYPLAQEYGGVKQRWLLVFSKQAYAKEIKTLDKHIAKEHKEISQLLWHTGNQLFGCEKDIAAHMTHIAKKLNYHRINYTIECVKHYRQKGRPKKGSQADTIEYRVVAELVPDEARIHNARITKGRFILATNQLDVKALPDHEILPCYKEQSGTESGFKFIKDDAFEVDSIFLKKPGRISALMMIMTLCLMVYSYAQYWLRQQLQIHQETIPSQSGKETRIPSMKWIYRLFHGVHVLNIKIEDRIQTFILNVNDLLRRIIHYFGDYAAKIYGT